MARFTARSCSAGSRTVTTCPMPIMMYRDTTSMRGGENLSRKWLRSSWALI